MTDSAGGLLSKTGSCETSCTYLSLQSKGITAVANGTFAGLERLQTLYLQDNQLTAAGLATTNFSDLPALQTLQLASNPGAPFACPTVSGYSSGCEMNRIDTCGGCTFWLDGRSWVLSKTGSCETSCTSLWLANLQIMAVANGTFDDVGSLQQLYLQRQWLGCVPGVAATVEIDRYWTTKTPRCPSNCTMDTYYVATEGICQHCPGSSYTFGIGGAGVENCTYPPTTSSTLTPTTTLSPSTTSPATTPTPTSTPQLHDCGGETVPFATASGDMICVPKHIYPHPEAEHCVFNHTWTDVIRAPDVFATGGLGKLLRAEWKVWVCAAAHPCVAREGDQACFTYSERHAVFVPWGFNSALRVVRNTTRSQKAHQQTGYTVDV